VGTPRTGITTEREGLTPKMHVKADGPPRPRRSQVGQALTEDAASTPAHPTPEATGLHMHAHDGAAAGHVSERALIVALDMVRSPPTGGTAGPRAGRGHQQMERVVLSPHALDAQASDVGKEQLGEHRAIGPLSRAERPWRGSLPPGSGAAKAPVSPLRLVKSNELKGDVKEGAGKLVGDQEMATEGRAEKEEARGKRHLKGAGNEVKGNLEESLGAVAGDESLRARGEADRLKGSSQRTG